MIKHILLIPLVVSSKFLTFNNKKCEQDFFLQNNKAPIQNRKKLKALEENWNIFTHNYVNGHDYLENFSPNGYSIRNGHAGLYSNGNSNGSISNNSTRLYVTSEFHTIGIDENGEEVLLKDGYFPNSIETPVISDRNIIGTDDRSIVDNAHASPYCITGFFEAKFSNIPVVGTSQHIDVITEGTGFLMGGNVVVTAAHIVYIDPSSGVYKDRNGNQYNVEDNTTNFRIADDINFYPGASYYGDSDSPEINPIEISIHKNYYSSRDTNYDWAMMMADEYIGYDLGYYGTGINWYQNNHHIYTYGYPDDGDHHMYYSPGKMQNKTEYKYTTNLDVRNGNSGGPIIYETELLSGLIARYAVGVVTSGNSSHTYGIKFTSFVGAFINSFNQSYWPSC